MFRSWRTGQLAKPGQRRLVVALIVARILELRSKLATVRGWDPHFPCRLLARSAAHRGPDDEDR